MEGNQTIMEWAEQINHYANENFDIRPIWEENTPKYLMYVVTELAEAMEAWRNNDKENFAEELADVIIRVLDLTTALDINIEQEIYNKMIKNWRREKNHGRKQV